MAEHDDRKAYLAQHNVEHVLLAAVAKLLRDRPSDPIGALGKMLSKPTSGFVSHTSWPTGLPRLISHAGPNLVAVGKAL